MTPQQLKTQTLSSTDAFSNLLGAHATLTRELSAALVASHGLTINDYGCLLLLSRAGEEGMRRSVVLTVPHYLQADDLAQPLSGRVEVVEGRLDPGEYAILTDAGHSKLREAAPGHIEDIDRRLSAVLSEDEMKTLVELLGRLSDSYGDCAPE